MSMNMDNIVGRVVGLILNNCRGLAMAGHDQKVHRESFFARIAGFDVFGLWAESRYKGVMTHVYFPWGNIKSIIYFPEKTEVTVDDGKKCLGFGCGPDLQKHLPAVKTARSKTRKHSPAKKKRRAR